MLNDSLYSSQKNTWETPDKLFELLDKEFNFELDVSADATNYKCEKYFSIEDDGLAQEWQGICWMNPPYGRDIKHWVEKASLAKTTVVCLLPSRTDTRWWHDFVMARACEIRFLNRRLTFKGSDNKAPFPAAIVIYHQEKTPLRVSALDIKGL